MQKGCWPVGRFGRIDDLLLRGAASFSDEFGLQDEAYFDALVLMFEKALKVSAALSIEQCDDFLARLDAVRDICHNFGYGVGDDMDRLLTEAGFDD